MAFSLCKTTPFTSFSTKNASIEPSLGFTRRRTIGVVKFSLSSSDGKKASVVSNSNYVVPIDDSLSFSNSSATITRPLAEILRDLNKKIPDTLVKPPHDPSSPTFIPWYHANRMLSFYAPGWCGEIRDVIFSDNGTVTVVYRLTVRGSDGERYGGYTWWFLGSPQWYILADIASFSTIICYNNATKCPVWRGFGSSPWTAVSHGQH